jgi:SSS family solute:Na+ symporter
MYLLAVAENAEQAMHGLSGIDYLALLVYLLAMLAMGIYFSLRQTSSDEYFLGQRSVPAVIVGISVVATLLSTITYLAAPGDMIQFGIYFMLGMLALPFWVFVVQRYWIPFFMRYRLTSVYEYAEMRFNYRVRALAASLFILMRFGWMGTIIYTAGRAVSTMTANMPRFLEQGTGITITQQQWLYTVMLAMGVIATGYTFLGGIRVVIWTDVIQFVVMIGGAIFAVVYIAAIEGTGPITWWREASVHWNSTGGAGSQFETARWWDPMAQRTVLFFVINAFFWRVCTHCGDQVATQRYFTTDGTKSALRSNLVNAAGDITLQVILGLVGLALLSFFVSRGAGGDLSLQTQQFGAAFDPANAAHAKDAYPVFIVNHLPPGLAGLLMAALFAAAMSSIDSGVNSTAAVVTTDFYRRLSKEPPQQVQIMRVARATTLCTGGAITLVAFAISWYASLDPRNENIIDLSVKIFNLFLGPLGAIFIVGIFLPRVGSAAMLLATTLGIGLSITLGYWKELVEVLGLAPEYVATVGPSALTITPTGAVATIIMAVLFSFMFRPPSKESIHGHTWWTRDAIRPPAKVVPTP